MSRIAEKTFKYNITRFQKNISRISNLRPSLNRVCANMFCVPVCTYYKLQREQKARICSRFCLNLEIISYPWIPRPYLNSLDQGNSGFDWKRWLHKGKLLNIYFWFDYENISDWRSYLSRLISNFKINSNEYIVQHLVLSLSCISLYILIYFWYATKLEFFFSQFSFVFFYGFLYILIWCEYFF